MKCLSLLLTIGAVACGNNAEPTSGAHSSNRYANAEQHYAVDQPDGWRVSLDRGFARFTSNDQTKAKHTIVIRSAVRPQELYAPVARY